METWKVLQLKHALEEFTTKVFDVAERIDTRQFPSMRYVLVLEYNTIDGSIKSSALEVRQREENAK